MNLFYSTLDNISFFCSFISKLAFRCIFNKESSTLVQLVYVSIFYLHLNLILIMKVMNYFDWVICLGWIIYFGWVIYLKFSYIISIIKINIYSLRQSHLNITIIMMHNRKFKRKSFFQSFAYIFYLFFTIFVYP